jgi:hypothetical protein
MATTAASSHARFITNVLPAHLIALSARIGERFSSRASPPSPRSPEEGLRPKTSLDARGADG